MDENIRKRMVGALIEDRFSVESREFSDVSLPKPDGYMILDLSGGYTKFRKRKPFFLKEDVVVRWMNGELEYSDDENGLVERKQG